MNHLNLDWIKQDASRRLQLTEKIGELQSLVDELYPGHKVLIKTPSQELEEKPKSIPSGLDLAMKQSTEVDVFDSMTAIGKMKFLLESGPMSSKEIFNALVSKGVEISRQTVMSTLSRKKDIFSKSNNGTWTLAANDY